MAIQLSIVGGSVESSTTFSKSARKSVAWRHMLSLAGFGTGVVAGNGTAGVVGGNPVVLDSSADEPGPSVV